MRRGSRLALLVVVVVAVTVLAWRRRSAFRHAAVPAGPTPPWPPLVVDGELAASDTATPPISGSDVPRAGTVEPEETQEPENPGATVWVRAVDGRCPEGFPVKAKVASGIYHLPGMMNYARTVPDRCYASASDAEAEGFRPAKR